MATKVRGAQRRPGRSLRPAAARGRSGLGPRGGLGPGAAEGPLRVLGGVPGRVRGPASPFWAWVRRAVQTAGIAPGEGVGSGRGLGPRAQRRLGSLHLSVGCGGLAGRGRESGTETSRSPGRPPRRQALCGVRCPRGVWRPRRPHFPSRAAQGTLGPVGRVGVETSAERTLRFPSRPAGARGQGETEAGTPRAPLRSLLLFFSFVLLPSQCEWYCRRE